jgi:calcineurin-like phosphoesterase family protein
MANTWFIADTHFSHNNILKYENRPFDDIMDMNNKLIAYWNSTVKNDDKIFILGDFALCKKETIKEIVEQLHGYKVLIMGNHDQLSPKSYIELGFNEVSRYPVILEQFWILSHAPMYLNESMPYANIFGHVHSNPEYKDYSAQSICVSVERAHMNYRPISFNKVKELMGVE